MPELARNLTLFYLDEPVIDGTAHAPIANVVDPTGQLAGSLPPGTTGQMVREMFNNLVTSQSLMLATNGLMMVIAVVFVAASIAIVLAPKAARTVDPASVGH